MLMIERQARRKDRNGRQRKRVRGREKENRQRHYHKEHFWVWHLDLSLDSDSERKMFAQSWPVEKLWSWGSTQVILFQSPCLLSVATPHLLAKWASFQEDLLNEDLALTDINKFWYVCLQIIPVLLCLNFNSLNEVITPSLCIFFSCSQSTQKGLCKKRQLNRYLLTLVSTTFLARHTRLAFSKVFHSSKCI